METALKKCPFCGGTATLRANWNPRRSCWFVYVKCNVCQSSSGTRAARNDPSGNDWDGQECHEVVNIWNMRCKDGNV